MKIRVIFGLLLLLSCGACVQASAQAVVPSIVYSGKFLSQTSTVATTTVYTPSAEGLYRVSVAGFVPAAASTCSVHGSLVWGSAGNGDGTSWSISSSNTGQNVHTVVVPSGTVIQYSVDTVSGGCFGYYYDLFIVVEQLE